MPTSSSFCSCVERPGCEGQSMFWTDATHTPLNSRPTGGGAARFCTKVTCDCPQAVSKPASTKSESSRTQNLLLDIGQQCKSDARETVPRRTASSFDGLQATDSSRADAVGGVVVGHGGNGWRRVASSYDTRQIHATDAGALSRDSASDRR